MSKYFLGPLEGDKEPGWEVSKASGRSREGGSGSESSPKAAESLEGECWSKIYKAEALVCQWAETSNEAYER